MTTDSILMVGKLHPQVRERAEAEFNATAIKHGDPELITTDLAQRIRGIACWAPIGADFIDALPQLEIIASFGVGYDAVDAKHAADCGVIVTNTPDVLTEEVADTTLGLLLNTLRELPQAEQHLRQGCWAREGSYPLTKLTLRDRTVGIYGLGRIGRAVARRLEGFDVEIRYHARHERSDVSYVYEPSLQALAEACDTLIDIVPAGAGTEKSVNAEVLAALGPEGVLINIGRGTTVDTDALIAALQSGTIAGAGLDVFPNEPNVPEALLTLPQVSLLPHVGSASVHTRRAMANLVVDNLASWFSQGRPLTPVAESRGLVAK